MWTRTLVALEQLLWIFGLDIYLKETSMLIPLSILWDEDIMIGIISGGFNTGNFFQAQSNLTHYFNFQLPLQQNHLWHEFKVSSTLLQWVISYLFWESLTLESLLRMSKIRKNTGQLRKDKLYNGKLAIPIEVWQSWCHNCNCSFFFRGPIGLLQQSLSSPAFNSC